MTAIINPFLMGTLCFCPMELINGRYCWFSMFEINHLKLILRDYRSKATSLTLGDVYRFVIRTNCSRKGLYNLFTISHKRYISCEEAVILLDDSKNNPVVFHQIMNTIFNKICRRISRPVAHEVRNLSRTDPRNQDDQKY